jgi:hypothetical protein
MSYDAGVCMLLDAEKLFGFDRRYVYLFLNISAYCLNLISTRGIPPWREG